MCEAILLEDEQDQAKRDREERQAEIVHAGESSEDDETYHVVEEGTQRAVLGPPHSAVIRLPIT